MLPSSSPKWKIFTCDQHASNISRKLQTFYQEQLLFDIALTTKTDNFKVHAHRTVLSASSEYFMGMLCSTLKDAKSDVIELEIDGATLKLVIDFMYTGSIELRCDNVSRIFKVSDVLKMSTLKAACSDFIKESIDVTNWLSVASLAKQQHSSELHEMAFTFALQHFEEVHQKQEFLQLTEKQLSELISSDDLCVNSEETVFHSLVSWVEYDKGNREKFMISLLQHMRFSFLNPDFIMANRHSVCKTMESFELISSWVESHLCPKLSVLHSERRKPNEAKTETLGFLSGATTANLKFQTYDPESGTWTYEDLPPPPTARVDYRATVTDKKLIIAKGLFTVCDKNTVECLDLQTKEWTTLPPMRQSRQAPGMVQLKNALYVVGGIVNGNWSRSVEKYDFRTREWLELAPMHSAVDFGKVTVLGELLYVVGNGNAIECYDPANNKWTEISQKNERSTRFGIAGLDGHLYTVKPLSAIILQRKNGR